MMAFVLIALVAVVVAINLYRAWRRDPKRRPRPTLAAPAVVRLTTTEQLRARRAELLT
jgi:uncharacterized membrane protein